MKYSRRGKWSYADNADLLVFPLQSHRACDSHSHTGHDHTGCVCGQLVWTRLVDRVYRVGGLCCTKKCVYCTHFKIHLMWCRHMVN